MIDLPDAQKRIREMAEDRVEKGGGVSNRDWRLGGASFKKRNCPRICTNEHELDGLNPKPEIRNPNQIPNPKSQTDNGNPFGI
jgi:hypothetical protein